MGWRRRYCPSPLFIAIIVALCVFYQCLSVFWKRTPWSKECDIRRGFGLLEVAKQNKECLCTWNSVVTKITDYEDRFKKKLFSNAKRRVLLHLYHSIGIEEFPLYKRVLTKLGYIVHQFAEIDNIKAFITHKQKPMGRDALMYIPSNESMEANCKEKLELVEFVQLNKENLLPQMQQILCIKDEICRLAAHFPELQDLSVCAHYPEGSWERKITTAIFMSDNSKNKYQYLTTQGINQLLASPYRNVYHHRDHRPFQDFPVIRTFVVITSLSPLRAFLHSMAMVQAEPKKQFVPLQLQKFYRQFFKSESPLQDLNALKEMISKLLLTLEVISEAGQNSLNRCSECFQLLTFDIGYSSASPPSVLEVKEQLMLNDLSVDGYTTMETILEDIFNFLLRNHSSGILEAIEKVQNCLSLKNPCWMDSILEFTWEQMDNLWSILQEQTKLGRFEMVYPSNSAQIKALRRNLYYRAGYRENLGSVLAVHDLLPELCECLQSVEEINLRNRYVKEQLMLNDLSVDGYTTMETILEDIFNFLLRNHSSGILEAIEKVQNCLSLKNPCWMDSILEFTWEQMDNLWSILQEQTKLGRFEMVYPSNSAQIKALRRNLYYRAGYRENLGSVLAVHDLLPELCECLQSVEEINLRNREKIQDKEENELSGVSGRDIRESVTRKWMNCSDDNDTLSYISRIFSNPSLDLTPEFNPKIKDYYAELPFDVVTVEIGAEPINCKSQVHLDDKNGPRVAKYPLGLGTNQITLHVTDGSSKTPVLLRSYRINIYREDRPSLPLYDHYKMCGFLQDCGLIIYAEEPCGLQAIPNETFSVLSYASQRKCETGDAKGYWLVPCLSCSDNRTCDWRAISWQPYQCYHPVLQNHELQQCLADRKIIFIGDSTNRGMMYYLMERVNGSLQEWQKTHDLKLFNNINGGRTSISYSYYPQFWIEIRKRPTFEEALMRLIKRSRPLQNTNQTTLVVGGVQWLNPDHLQIIQRVLKRENLLDILVIIKSIGMGFHLPVHGIRSLSPVQVSHLSDENSLILKTAKLYGYQVVDTFSITMGRYKEFLQGKCGCHFHEVVKSKHVKEKKIKLLKNYTFGGKIFPHVYGNLSYLKSLYHVQGPVNQVYSEILLSRMCT
ncbi:cadherin-like and PC-esterase domain-containing protein 1 [Bufo gargarizans]|uniref:cadherin-like and PC-esterase domain-containing protein 1 n=1 Tax=Bufo gargarizans TaxID=30331 RepID=UPI001CF1A635|nr:cadherin-like and PC-esterase domain-containing protein 1 [Bufo gargarizans]